MKKFDMLVLKFFLYGLPLVVIAVIGDHVFQLEQYAAVSYFAQLLYGFIVVLFMLLATSLSIWLLVSESFRQSVLTKLTLIKESDEREVILTGQAAKNTMLTSLAILICLFCFSCFQFSILSMPSEQAVDGKTNVLKIGFKYQLLEPSYNQNGDVSGKRIAEFSGLPISSSTIILGIIIWQISSYNFSMKKLMK